MTVLGLGEAAIVGKKVAVTHTGISAAKICSSRKRRAAAAFGKPH